jgi:Reverse transcriptase (RNA-dependent DNA polymerase)/Endonuclease-reverse transcriptase
LTSRELFFEISGVTLKLGLESLIIVSIYRPSNPKSDAKLDKFFEDVEKSLSKIQEQFGEHVRILVAGDFNIDLLKNDGKTNRLKNVFATFGLHLVNNEPTRITATSKTLIDHIFTNIPLEKLKYKTESVIFSDHESLVLTLPMQLRKLDTKLYQSLRSFTPINLDRFYSCLLFEKFHGAYNFKNVNDKYSSFYGDLFKYFDSCFPLRKVCFDSKKPFKIPTFLKEEAERIKMFSKYIKSNPSVQDSQYLHNWKKYHGWLILQVKAQHNSDVINKSKNKIKASWAVVNSSLGNEVDRKRGIEKLIINDTVIENPLQIANILNKTFVVNNNDSVMIPDLSHIPRNLKLFFLTPTTPGEVLKIIESLSNTKAAGSDQIPCNVMKHVGALIAAPFSEIVNTSFAEGEYPDLLKLSLLIATFKNKGKETDPSCYRPIANLSCFSKVIGKLFSIRLISFFTCNKLFYQHQHGFMKKKGTATALFELVNNIYSALEDRQQCLGIFYDFSKAFDSISHRILFEKLQRYGIVGTPLNWIKSFLTGRKQKVSMQILVGKLIQNIESDEIFNETGIAQGSILGPSIFNIFINDLALLALIAFIILYADDSNSLLKAPTTQLLFSAARASNSIFESWARDHLLNLNSDKTAVMQFHSSRSNVNSSPLLFLDGKSLQSSEQTKFLGVFVDESLDFKIHCTKLNTKLSSSAFMFVILRRSTYNLDTLKSVYFAYVQSHLQYGLICWGNSVLAITVFQNQRKIIRAMLGFRYKRYYKALKSCHELFPKLDILTLPSLYIYECSKFYRKHTHYFTQNNETHAHNTRRNRDVLVRSSSKSPYNNIATTYNKLPREIKAIESYGSFVKTLRKFLIKKCYYSVNDYFAELWQS